MLSHFCTPHPPSPLSHKGRGGASPRPKQASSGGFRQDDGWLGAMTRELAHTSSSRKALQFAFRRATRWVAHTVLRFGGRDKFRPYGFAFRRERQVSPRRFCVSAGETSLAPTVLRLIAMRSHQPVFGIFDRLENRRCLVDRFIVFRFGITIGDDAAAGLHADRAVLHEQGADGDAHIH